MLIVWERTPDAGIVDYNIYREGKLIGTVGYDELSVFEDSEVDPERRPYKYTMTTTDSCGNESEHSAYHIPIFLQYTGYIDGVNLSWAKYLIQGKEVQFNSYTVYKGSDSTSIVPFVENIPNEVTVYVDDDPLALEKKFYYRVAGILDNPCYPSGGDRKTQTGPYRHSLSNLDDNKLKEPGDSTGTDGLPCTDHKLSVYPNPFSLSATVMFPNPDNKPYTLVLSGLSGKIYRLVGEITTSEYILKRGDLKPGLYILELRGPKIFRGKLMIE